MDKTEKNRIYLIYTLIFISITPIVFGVFLTGRKSLIWEVDGIRQHYIALMYFGNWGREIFKNILDGMSEPIPLWDFQIGYGSDIITTMHYYVLGDPLNLLSIFVPQKYTEMLYQGLILLRFYLSGISFLFYCREMKKGRNASLGGAINYTFCGFMLYAGIRHPFFITPMICLPVISAGIERIFRRKKPTLFIFMVFLSAVSNFYFFYMIAFAVCFYVAVRFFTFSHEHPWNEAFRIIFRFLGYAATGICMAAVIFLPVIMAFLSTGRSRTSQVYPALYRPGYYAKLLAGFLNPAPVGEWTILGFTAPAFFSIFILFSSKKKYKPFKLSFLIMTVMLCIPFFARALNGFSYVSNRWCFLYSGLVSYILTCVWDDMALLFSKTTQHTDQKTAIRHMSAYLLVLSILHVCANAVYLYSEHGKNYASQFLPSKSAYERIMLSAPAALQLASGEETSFFRYETDDFHNRNVSAVVGAHGIEYYWSLENSVIPDYYMDMSLKSFHVFNYTDLDRRTFLDTLSGVRYFVSAESSSAPYGFTYKNTVSLSDQRNYNIYQNQYALPLGYTYRFLISEQDYIQMDAARKQEALLQGIVIHSKDNGFLSSHFSEITPQFQTKLIDYTVKYGKNITQNPNGSIRSQKKNAKIELSFQGMKNCETYLLLEGASIQADNPFRNEFWIRVTSNDGTNRMRYLTPSHKYHKGQKNYLINLGYHENAQTNITVTLPYKGLYYFQNMKIICQPMGHYKKQIKELTKDVLKHEKIGTNIVEGTVSLKEEKILCLTIPYSTGWSAWVDGKKAGLLRANGMFLALPLSKGSHTVKLQYRTPGLLPGILFSLLGWGIFFGIELRSKKNKRRNKSSHHQ